MVYALSIFFILYVVCTPIGQIYYHLYAKKGDEQHRMYCIESTQRFMSIINSIATATVYFITVYYIVFFILAVGGIIKP